MIVKTINLENQYFVEDNEKLIVTIGAFDALHIGHKKLFNSNKSKYLLLLFHIRLSVG